MHTTDHLRQMLLQLKLLNVEQKLSESLVKAQTEQMTHQEWLTLLLQTEINEREHQMMTTRIKRAKLPQNHLLEHYDFGVDNGISKTQMNQLQELHWLEQHFNVILMGPSGTGKTFIAAGLAYLALKAGYKAIFRTMEDLARILKLSDMTKNNRAQYNACVKADLLVIDDLMMFPIEKKVGQMLFHLIDTLHEKSSVIITTNKSPKEWAEALDDQVLATAMLDRLLHRAQVVQLKGESYRMKNRKTIF